MTDPKIAVLIPVFNEEPVLEGTIKALRSADVDRQDIYIVDDKSTDRTVEIAQSLGVHVWTVPENGGKARAQVAALKVFDLYQKYDWIIFLDGDTKVDPYFFTAMFKAAKEDPSVALYVGQVKSVANRHAFSATRAVEYAYGQDLAKQAQSNFNVVFVSPGCASMYRTDILSTLQIDEQTLAEDMDLTIQVHRVGGRVKYLPSAIVFTQDPNNLKDYYRQILRWYRGFWQVVVKHGTCNPFSRKQWVDAYMLLLIIDATIFNRAIWLVGLCAAFPNRIIHVLITDIVVMFLVQLYGAIRTKRFDILKFFPHSYCIGFVSIAAYLRAFFEIIIFRKNILAWNKVKRYDFSAT